MLASFPKLPKTKCPKTLKIDVFESKHFNSSVGNSKKFNIKWTFKPFTVIRDHIFRGQWKGDIGLNNTV